LFGALLQHRRAARWPPGPGWWTTRSRCTHARSRWALTHRTARPRSTRTTRGAFASWRSADGCGEIGFHFAATPTSARSSARCPTPFAA
jgi:hypothetical protein